MAHSSPDSLRNVGIVAHINAGKTTLTERILFATGRQKWMGEVDLGTSTMDWMAEEQERGISITAAFSRVQWQGHNIHLIDTPGHVDFIGEVARSLRVMDGLVVLLDGIRGVEPQTEIVWRQADHWGLPRLVFVNKMDRDTADFAGALDTLAEALHPRAVPIVVPIREGRSWTGLLDVVRGSPLARAGGAVPEVDPEFAAAARSTVVEACAEWDEDILAAFVEGRPVSDAALDAALLHGCHHRLCVPVLAGAALENTGVDHLLTAVCRYLPDPARGSVLRRAAHDRPAECAPEPPPEPSAPACALVFKIQRDEQQDLLHSVRVFSGTVRPGDTLACAARGGSWRVLGVWSMHAMDRDSLELVGPGEIVALTLEADSGTRPLRTGDTLHDPSTPSELERTVFQAPVMLSAVEPVEAHALDGIVSAAGRLAEEDPTLEVRRDPVTGSLTVAGMGELHLSVFASRLQTLSGQRVRLARPQVARSETVAERARARVECRGKLGGREYRATAEVEVGPDASLGPGRMIAGLPAVARPELPWGAVRETLEGALATGLWSGNPTIGMDLRVLGLDGDAPLPDGEGLYLQAVTLAARKAMGEAGPRLLEPLVSLEITCPGDVLTGVLGDLKARGARVDSVASGQIGARITGEVRLQAMVGYATQLRSLSRGQGHVQIAPAGYGPAPPEASAAAQKGPAQA